MAIESYEDLLVWQKSMRLAEEVEKIASRLPAHHKYVLASQLRRSSGSIPFNIAEGSVRPTRVYINHVLIALGSEAELKTQLKLAAKVKLVSESEVEPLIDLAADIGRMLRGLVRGLRAHLARQNHGPDP
jgi:four helix bundle protein